MKLGELYGQTDPLTFEWSDGLIASATRRFARDPNQTSSDESRPVSVNSPGVEVRISQQNEYFIF